MTGETARPSARLSADALRGARVLYVMAHPDDEDAVTLTWLAQEAGAEVFVFSLTRGELGDNAVGTELAERLGALRMDEMAAAARAYGVRAVLYGGCFDYGYSKRLEEAEAKWGRVRVECDVVRAIRAVRPSAVISRFRGAPEDGHAHHRIVGQAAHAAFVSAADAACFPELSGAGLGPFQAAALWVDAAAEAAGNAGSAKGHTSEAPGGASDAAHERIAASPDTVARARAGYVLHRSQVTERLLPAADDGVRVYARVRVAEASALAAGAPAPIDDALGLGEAHIAPLRRASFVAHHYDSPASARALLARPDTADAPDAALAVGRPGELHGAGGVRFVRGTGDCVGHALRELGFQVSETDADHFSSADGAPVVLVGVRAFACARDPDALASALGAAANAGASVVVLAQTKEFDPARHAPFAGELRAAAPEVAEEDAAVELLAPGHRFFSRPSRVTARDWEGWVEQRGSKFWSAWDPRYTPLVRMADAGEGPAEGAWLHASVGAGEFTYCALALHRQLPFGVPGAWRLLLNLASPR